MKGQWGGVFGVMSIQQAMRQAPVQTGRAGDACGEAARAPVSDEASCQRRESANIGSALLANSRRWWRNSDRLPNSMLAIAHFDRLGVPRLS